MFYFEFAGGIPGSEESECEDDECDQQDVGSLYLDRVSGDDVFTSGAEFEPSEMLLAETECNAENESDGCSQGGDEPSFIEEDAPDGGFVCAEVGEYLYAFTLVDDEHRKRADDVEAGDEEDEDKEEDGKELLDAEDAEEVGLLLIAIQHFELRSKCI